ncbi:MAG: hypothetical protein JSV88_09445, partial [Candidatus Aminicenantes bacterium]
QSTKWVPTYIEIERIKKEALKLGEKKGRKEGLVEGEKKKAKKMAKKMKKEREPIEKILKYTGLSREEIEEL